MLEGAIFRDLDEARVRVGHFAAWYNFQRTHQGIGGLVPADRYFEAAAEVRAALEKRVAENAIELALHGEPRKSVYMTGRVGGEAITLHGEGTRVILTGADGTREEVDLEAPGRRVEDAPGTSELDAVLEDLEKVGEPGAEPDEAASADASPDDASPDESEES